MASCFAILDKKDGQSLKAARMFNSEVRLNRKMPNGVKLNVLQNGYLRFLTFFDFDQQNSKFIFLNIIACKIQNIQAIQKIAIYVIEIHTNNIHAKFQSNIFVFGCAMAKKTGEGDDVTFLKCSFGISNCRICK